MFATRPGIRQSLCKGSLRASSKYSTKATSSSTPSSTRAYSSLLSTSARIRSRCITNARCFATAASHKPIQDSYKNKDGMGAKVNPAKTDGASSETSALEKDKNLPFVKVDEKKVHVGWDPLTWSRYLNFWLRDHCRCPECFHQVTKQRLVDTFEIPPDVQPTKAEATTEGLKVTWHASSTPHVSIYPWDWLKWHSPDPVPLNPGEEPPFQPFEKVLWGAKIVQDPPTVQNDYVMNDDRGLWKLLRKIDVFGFCFVQGVEATPEATEKLAIRVANIRQTQYGTFWDFTSDLAKGDTAYTTLALGAHTDTTYFTDPCGLQLFHLLSHTDGHGGETLLVDGFYVASILKELHPEAYHTLSTVPVPTHAAGEPGDLFRPNPPSGYPILNLDEKGRLWQVRYNNDDRSAMKGVGVDVLEKWYEALRLWNNTLRSADSEYWVQLGPGTAVIVDNHRVLHGRSAFDGKRRMCGAYIGVDDYRSKLTVLTERFGGGRPVTETEAERVERGEEFKRSNWSPLF